MSILVIAEFREGDVRHATYPAITAAKRCASGFKAGIESVKVGVVEKKLRIGQQAGGRPPAALGWRYAGMRRFRVDIAGWLASLRWWWGLVIVLAVVSVRSRISGNRPADLYAADSGLKSVTQLHKAVADPGHRAWTPVRLLHYLLDRLVEPGVIDRDGSFAGLGVGGFAWLALQIETQFSQLGVVQTLNAIFGTGTVKQIGVVALFNPCTANRWQARTNVDFRIGIGVNA